MMNHFLASPRHFLVFGLSLLALALAACGSPSGSPDAVVTKLYRAIEANRMDEAASYFSTRHLGQTSQATQLQGHLRNVLTQAHARILDSGGLDQVKVIQTKQDDPVAAVDAEVKLKNGRTYRVSYSMTKEDNGWKAVLHANNLDNLSLR